MRVLHLAPPAATPHSITAHSFIDEEIVALRRAGIECLTLPPPAPARLRDRVGVVAFGAAHALRLPTAALRSLRETAHAIRLEAAAAHLIRAHGVDIVHSHFGWPAGFGGALAAAAAGVPLVASLRGMDLLAAPQIGYGLRRDPAYDAAVRQLLRTAEKTLYATEYMRRSGIAAGAPPDRAILIRKGVDLIRFQPAPRDRPAEAPTILAVGTLSKRKNLQLVLDALARMSDLAWTFVIVGDGSEQRALDAQAAALGIRDRVRFAGSVGRNEIGGYFAAADVFVHAAVMEAAGNVILEALASGCPIVCTDAGGPSEYVRDGDTGFVVAPGDADALASRLRLLLSTPSRRRSMSTAARASAEREFGYGRLIGDLIQIYEGVVRCTDPSRQRYVRLTRRS